VQPVYTHHTFQPCIQGLFDELVLSFWNLELFLVDQILVLQVDFVRKIVCQSEVTFVEADCGLVVV